MLRRDLHAILVPLCGHDEFMFSSLYRVTWVSFSHNTVPEVVEAQQPTVLLSKVALVGKDLLDRILGMTTAGDTQREKGAVVERSRGYFRGQDKSVTGIHGSMLFQTKVRLVVLDCPVGIEVAGKLHRLSHLIQTALGSFFFNSFFLQFVLAEGMTGRLYESGVDGNSFVDG